MPVSKQDGCIISAAFAAAAVSVLVGLALNVVIIWAIIKAVLYFF